MLDYQGTLDEQGQYYLTRIQEASGRMGQLIEDLLNLSRITRSEVNLVRVDFSSVARQISDELQEAAMDQGATFYFTLWGE